MTIGEKIKALRIEQKLSMEELAYRMGYANKSAIARIEKGATDLPQSRISQFARVLGTTPGHLMGWDVEPEKAGSIAAMVLKDRDAFQLVQDYFSLSETDKYTMRLMAASLAAKQKKD